MEILWDYRVVLDLFLGGVGIGTFLFATILYAIDSEKFQRGIKKSWIISPILIILGLVLLLTELGRPLNVIKAIYNTNSTSVMSIGMFLQGICVALMLLIVVKLFTSKINEIPKALIYITGLFAGLVGIYHGFLLTGIERIAWSDSIPSVFFISSILAGSSLATILAVSNEGYKELMSKLRLPAIFNIVLTLQIVSIFSWVYSLAIRGSETKLVYIKLMTTFGSEFWFFVIVGIIIPIILFTIMLLKKIETKAMLITATLCIITGSLVIKYIVVYIGQMV